MGCLHLTSLSHKRERGGSSPPRSVASYVVCIPRDGARALRLAISPLSLFACHCEIVCEKERGRLTFLLSPLTFSSHNCQPLLLHAYCAYLQSTHHCHCCLDDNRRDPGFDSCIVVSQHLHVCHLRLTSLEPSTYETLLTVD